MKKIMIFFMLCVAILGCYWIVQIINEPEKKVVSEMLLSKPLVFYKATRGMMKEAVQREEINEIAAIPNELVELAKGMFPLKNMSMIGYQNKLNDTLYFYGYLFDENDKFMAGVELYSKDIDSIIEVKEALMFAQNHVVDLDDRPKVKYAAFNAPESLKNHPNYEEKKIEIERQLSDSFFWQETASFIEILGKIALATPLYRIRIFGDKYQKSHTQTALMLNQGTDKLNVKIVKWTY